MVVLADHLLTRPAGVLARVQASLATAGVSVPDRLDPDWRLLDPAW